MSKKILISAIREEKDEKNRSNRIICGKWKNMEERMCIKILFFECCIIRIYCKAWRDENPELAKKNNIRDFASINELTILSNLETHNARMIRDGRNKAERFQILKRLQSIS